MSSEAVQVAKEGIKATKEVAKAVKDSGVEQKLIDMLDAIQHGAAKVGDTIVHYSPDVVDAALWVVRINAIQALVMGFVFLVINIVLWKGIIIVWKKDWSSHGEPTGHGILGCINFIAILVTGWWAVISVFDIWQWVAIIQPKLFIARQLINHII